MDTLVKRLTPTKETLRMLYLKSGNQCAFPKCSRVLINDEGAFIAQVCHIEAAEKGGERFNPSQSNEERRGFQNLMLLCYEHHVVTNEVAKFGVAEMRSMKGAHEKKFGDIAQVIGRSISDYTESSTLIRATNLRKLAKVLDWPIDDYCIQQSLPEFNDFCAKVKKLPVPTREIFVVIVSRSLPLRAPGIGERHAISLPEVKLACALGDQELSEHVHVLERYNLIMDYESEHFDGLSAVRLTCSLNGWEIASDLKAFSSSAGIPLERMLVSLDFSVLDEI